MAYRFANFLYGSVPAEFPSDFGFEESVWRLRAAVKPNILHALFRQAAVGSVYRTQVSLQRVIPFFGNGCKPFFVGSFHERNGRVVLFGNFTMSLGTKIFMTVWLGFCLLWTVLVLVISLVKQPEQAPMALAGIVMFALGCGFVRFSQWLSRSDVAWLSAKIRRALSNEITYSTAEPDRGGRVV